MEKFVKQNRDNRTNVPVVLNCIIFNFYADSRTDVCIKIGTKGTDIRYIYNDCPYA